MSTIIIVGEKHAKLLLYIQYTVFVLLIRRREYNDKNKRVQIPLNRKRI